MSTSLLYHAFGIQGYRYVRTAYVEGQIRRPTPRRLRRIPRNPVEVLGPGSWIPRAAWRRQGLSGLAAVTAGGIAMTDGVLRPGRKPG
jgi:hypothetical protein